MLNREASGLYSALRLQKLRALEIILDSIASNENKNIAVAVEFYEDVYALTEDEELFEQDKNYDPDTKFTFNSEEILKSLCSFIDIFSNYQFDENLIFCFVTTNQIGKEQTTKRLKRLNLKLPTDPILSILESRNEQKIEAILEFLKEYIIDYYGGINDQEKLDDLKLWSNVTWTSFFKQIRWVYNNPSIQAIEESVEKKIKECIYFSSTFNEDTIGNIKSNLLDTLDSRATNKNRFFRLIQKDTIKLAFRNLGSMSKSLEDDPVYQLWETIDKPTDVRNLSEKILAVCPTFDRNKIKHLERKASIAKIEEIKYNASEKYVSLKFRVFTYCEKELYERIKNRTEFSELEIEKIINEIENGCKDEFAQLRQDFDYGITRETIILELFIEFLDSCFLAFDL